MGTKVQGDRNLEEDLALTLPSLYILPANLARVLHPSYSQLVHKQRSLGLHFCALHSGIL
jgi:hypothetical protein